MKIEVKNITKSFGKTKALEDVSFTLAEPKIYGLLGRNGAGKTTFMDILAGHQLANKGEILINSEHPFENGHITEKICLIKETDNFHKDLTIKQIFRTCALFYPNWDQTLADELVKEYQLPIRKRLKTYSKGMASAVGIIVGLASKAPLTIFDEPYIGLDAAARKKFYDILLEEYEAEKRTIIFSTHLIDEVSLLFEEILVLKQGQLILQENTDTLRAETFTITGEREIVEPFIQGKHVIHKKKIIANMMAASLFGNKAEAEKAGLHVEGVPIQDLMIYITEKGEEVNDDKGI